MEWLNTLFSLIYFIMYLSVFLNVYLVPMEIRRILGLLKGELWMVVNHYVCWKSNSGLPEQHMLSVMEPYCSRLLTFCSWKPSCKVMETRLRSYKCILLRLDSTKAQVLACWADPQILYFLVMKKCILVFSTVIYSQQHQASRICKCYFFTWL